MNLAKGALLLLVLLGATLAGCASKGSNCQAFCVTAPAAVGQPYTFSATVVADNYTWDFGDNLGVGYGKDVQYTYDVANANLTVRLFAKTGTEGIRYDRNLMLGDGLNHPGTFLLEAEKNWIVTGERVRFSARLSSDPDHDNLRFAWACQRNGDAVRVVAHSHGNVGPAFVSPPAGHVTSGLANHALPAPDKSLDASADLCTSLGTIGSQHLSTGDMTIEGTFQQQGKYSIFLVAADPAHPTVSGFFDVVVTPPGDRPNATMTWPFAGHFTAGASEATGTSNVQTVCDAANSGKTCDKFVGHLDMPLGASSSWVNFTYLPTDPTGAGLPMAAQNQAKWELYRSTSLIQNGGPAQDPTHLDASSTPSGGPLDFVITASQGGNFDFHIQLQSKMDLDPLKYY